MSEIRTIRVRFYERHEDGEPVYTTKAYDYLCRFKRVDVGTPVVVESAFGLGLAKVVAVGIKSEKATKHVVGTVDCSDEEDDEECEVKPGSESSSEASPSTKNVASPTKPPLFVPPKKPAA